MQRGQVETRVQRGQISPQILAISQSLGLLRRPQNLKKIWVILLTKALCSVRATAYYWLKSRWRFFKTYMVKSYCTNFNPLSTKGPDDVHHNTIPPPSPRFSCLPTALYTLCRLLLPSADYVNRKSPVMTICIVKWWPFSNQTNIQCYSSVLQHGKVPSSIYNWSIRLLFLLHPGFKSWIVIFVFSFSFSYVSLVKMLQYL